MTKLLGVPIIHVAIAIGILGIVTMSYFAHNRPALTHDDTLRCQRTYNFTEVKFTTEAKTDWDKCYMPEPLYQRTKSGRVICDATPEYSCDTCAWTLALKYNKTNYCELLRPCGWPEDYISACKNATLGIKYQMFVRIVRVNTTDEIRQKAEAIYPQRPERMAALVKLWWNPDENKELINKYYTLGSFD